MRRQRRSFQEGVGEVCEEVEFEGTGRLDGLAEVGHERVELGLLVREEDELVRAESVSDAVLRRAGLALLGTRSGGVLGVGLVGGELSCRCHGVQIFVLESKRWPRGRPLEEAGGSGRMVTAERKGAAILARGP